MLDRYMKMILNSRVYEVAQETPLVEAERLSRRLGNRVWMKREDLQPVYSFKLRGAYNKIANLSDAACANGVIAASAGNHAQGVALAARKRGVKALIVMPQTTPSIKVESVRHLGARISLSGDTYDEAYKHASKLAAEKGMTFIHPYDDPEVIAGQGTVGLEILREHAGDIHAIFVPVGGGGLIAGIAACIKALQPSIKVIGVEPDEAPCMHQALKRGRRVKLKQVGIFADGVAVNQAGKEPFRIAREHVDEVILVNTDEICAAIKDVFDECRAIVEPAGALAIAGMKRYVKRTGISDVDLVAVNSGANINFDRLRHVAERAEVGEQREALLVVTIPEEPGSFRRFCRTLGKRGITEFNYRYADAQQAHVFAGVQLDGGDKERHALVRQLRRESYPVEDLTDSEIAKLHIRYMVGGRAMGLEDEVLYRFQFPERPGALLQFLTVMGRRWNISLFHYRNHGADYGRVLMGIQVPHGSRTEFKEFLNELGYRFWEESDCVAYRLFLGGS
ncbi:MAG: threonine ammonia-lyase, biosynthetic [Gammaproteobacteria bacterium]|nr:threonine ammonia-lyase, biosynthetic [Gammaproteobacteria bacterium]MDH3560599.1 threonine ammonia-lyase, biosynthetic [Gammaproteobacteria bacterium]